MRPDLSSSLNLAADGQPVLDVKTVTVKPAVPAVTETSFTLRLTQLQAEVLFAVIGETVSMEATAPIYDAFRYAGLSQNSNAIAAIKKFNRNYR